MPNDAPNELTSWVSGPWFLRQGRMFLIPGDSAMGYRLPLDSLPWIHPDERPQVIELDPFAERSEQIRSAIVGQPQLQSHPNLFESVDAIASSDVPRVLQARGRVLDYVKRSMNELEPALAVNDKDASLGRAEGKSTGHSSGSGGATDRANQNGFHGTNGELADEHSNFQRFTPVVRTALCVEAREGVVHVFMPPVERIEQYFDLVSAIEATADELSMPVRIEGYPPPYDYRVDHFKVTPDPGVIEVNLQPARNWNELVRNTTTLYEEAHLSRLSTEKFMLDGRHTGTGGGNHIVLGGPSPAQSPFLRRPDLLRSFVCYWNNRPSLSYLFSGLFIGPTSQAQELTKPGTKRCMSWKLPVLKFPKRDLVRPGWSIDCSVIC